MANPPKQKGTGGEREVKVEAEARGFTVDRMPPSSNFDLRVHPHPLAPASAGHLDGLATRPDHGRWLVTIPLGTLLELMEVSGYRGHIEVKRYKRFSLHTIFEGKFGR